MSKTEKLIDRILEMAAVKLSKNCNGSINQYRSILYDVMGEVKCQFIFSRGTRKGETCGVLFCQHHSSSLAPQKITQNRHRRRRRMRGPDPHIINATNEIYKKNFGSILADEKMLGGDPLNHSRAEVDRYFLNQVTEKNKEKKCYGGLVPQLDGVFYKDEDPDLYEALSQSAIEYNVEQIRKRHERPVLGHTNIGHLTMGHVNMYDKIMLNK